jgi:hypothetical protein
MTRFFSYAVIVIGMGATATLAISPRTVKPSTSAEVRFAADGAYRDGLYLGKLAAESGQPPRAAVGRWSADQDRLMFAAGYRSGYKESLTRAPANVARARQAE